MGKYIHNSNSTYPIYWQVLTRDEENHRALVISKYGLGQRKFDTNSRYFSKSVICQWLNGTFYNSAFTDTEKTYIASTEINDGVYNGTYKVFLLSKYEAETYFADNNARICNLYYKNTGNAILRNWWLRTPYGSYVNGVYIVNDTGGISGAFTYNYNNPNSYNSYLVRPAMWVNI